METPAKVPIDVALRRTSDGLTRIHRYDVEPQYLDIQVGWWTDGNGACDCNRHMSFEGHDGSEPEEEEMDCGDTVYALDWVKNAATGEVLYSA